MQGKESFCGDWGYGMHNGPHTWSKSFPFAAGCIQSPINIDLNTCKYDMTLNINPLCVSMGPGRFNSQTMVLTNHGFRIDCEGPACIRGGPVPVGQVAQVSQITFHWGSTVYGGSEHLINCFQFPCECQILCYNSSRYRCFDEAKCQPNGVLILSILMHIGNLNKGIKLMMGPLCSLHYFKTHDFRQEEMIDVNALLPVCINRYFTYPGSLTAPPCYESVTWIILENSVSMSENQLNEFQKCHMGDSCCGPDNYRPVCPLGSRFVCKNFN